MGEKRRGAGEGSIYRREDGRWVGQYEVEGKRRYVYGQDRESVRARPTKALADREAGLVFDSRNLTVGEYAPLWLDSIREAVGPRTWKRHEELTRLHTDIRWLHVAHGERRDPVVDRDQTQTPWHPQVPSQLLPRRSGFIRDSSLDGPIHG